VVNVHLDAVEHGDNIVFMHTVKEGPANQSYGLQVTAFFPVFPAVHARCPGGRSSRAGCTEKINPDELAPREALETRYRLRDLNGE